jgi:hypothetical protein
MDNASRVISGTWGEIWLDGEYVAEVFKLQAKISFTKEDVHMVGSMFTDSKTTAVKGTGSIGMHKVNSRMVAVIGDHIVNGRDKRFTIVSKLADPDAYGAERVSIPNVSFDDLTLADWEAAKKGQIECPFTFAGSPKWLDRIGVA